MFILTISNVYYATILYAYVFNTCALYFIKKHSRRMESIFFTYYEFTEVDIYKRRIINGFKFVIFLLTAVIIC